LAVDCEPTLEARINPALLEQAVVNLVDNAIRFSESGGRVEIEAVRVDESVLIRVRDYGCGIDPEHLPRIFDRFYQIETAGTAPAGGTGLGLAIVQHIARAHGGGVRVTSAPGEGSTFTIDLPD
jgi:two-component system phosphate regulon sensor histidine kinase PhoR